MLNSYKKLLVSIFLFFLLCIIFRLLGRYFQPLFIMIFLIILIKPIYRFLCKVRFLNHKLKVIISLLIVNIFFLGILLRIGNILIRNYNILIEGFYYIIGIYKNICKNILSKNNNLNLIFHMLKPNKINFLNGNIIKHGAESTTSFLFSYFISNIMTYFILADKEKILDFSKHVFPEKVIATIYKSLKTLSFILIIEIKLMIICTFITTIGFYMLGLNNFFSMGILCGILDILPYVGTIFIFLPIILYGIIIKDYLRVIGFICLYLLILILRQILETKYLSKSFQIHPLATIISVYIFIKFTGIIGFFLGPMYIIIIKEIINLGDQ
ncbi:AI-2E family transporter [Hathewaya histolytica]|uniref:Permease n=1 Tax=Hathewaya histolytica TaxID=1498 RepID=A0A4U9RCW7_HATHI|nr:AI-2E family transporter [Hathewaya histolytica]VTQ89582.1 permease [Hathewaya histolytica]